MQNNILDYKPLGSIGYQVYGDPTAAMTVLYFHGLPGSRLEASLADEAAKALNIKIISFDRPGFGLSTFSKDRTAIDVAQAVDFLITTLGVRQYSVLGVSGGTPYALACCALFPEKISNAVIVSGMGPIFDKPNSLNFVPTAMHWTNRTILRLGIKSPRLSSLFISILVRSWKAFPLSMVAWFNAVLTTADKRLLVKDDTRRAMVENMQASLQQGPVGALQDFKQLCRYWGFDLSSVRQPVTIWHGEADNYVPVAYAELMQTLLPRAELVRIQRAGHFMILRIIPEVLQKLKDSLVSS